MFSCGQITNKVFCVCVCHSLYVFTPPQQCSYFLLAQCFLVRSFFLLFFVSHPAYLPTYPSTYLPTYIHPCPSTYVPSCQPIHAPMYLPTYLPTNLPTYIPMCPPAYILVLTGLSTDLVTNIMVQVFLKSIVAHLVNFHPPPPPQNSLLCSGKPSIGSRSVPGQASPLSRSAFLYDLVHYC
jgi:hypothetical protein